MVVFETRQGGLGDRYHDGRDPGGMRSNNLYQWHFSANASCYSYYTVEFFMIKSNFLLKFTSDN